MTIGIVGVKSAKEVECMSVISNRILVDVYYQGGMCCGEHNRAQGKGELQINNLKDNRFVGNIIFLGQIGCNFGRVSDEPVDIRGEVRPNRGELGSYELVLAFEFSPPYLPHQFD